ncbi:saccharopine dehydrogenase family protein [Natronoglycomyces albus]|uniref:Saccharopine dehydrogenase NADP-binding domain-containing protein n=1 Tax=Natronoglycomyces albus TaxID=2811108 RepID=A0A895XSQ8_9ACTN|nr:saccharopine dehydrogenase family protein [Natronoglycomyces albus]QSB04668.1 saccharopine dehydrogenase NADP-binding domain-containing protein [Natronoglycomyces albus]
MNLESTSPTIHWVGIGMSTGHEGLSFLSTQATVVVWGRNRARAAQRLEQLGLPELEHRGLDVDDLASALRPGDVLVSMLPASHHADLLRTALEAGAHFACTSYTSEEMAQAGEEAVEKGLVILTEAGLDPGIDHLMAHCLVAQARNDVGDVAEAVTLRSYCGGIPAQPGEFRYQFSWAPVGVLKALGSQARYIEGGKAIVAEQPWEATREHQVNGETFEVYPNRDSIGFVEQYGFPSTWQVDQFVRGTLRPDGWRQAWKPVFEAVASRDEERISALAHELAQKYPTTEADRDRVLLTVTLEVKQGSRRWQGEYTLDTIGDERDTAMARCVTNSFVFALSQMVQGKFAPGLHRATDDEATAQRWLEFLAEHGLATSHTVSLTEEESA